MKAKTLLSHRRQLLPIGAYCVKKVKSAIHVALNESPRAIDGTVNVALGRQIHHKVGIGVTHRC